MLFHWSMCLFLCQHPAVTIIIGSIILHWVGQYPDFVLHFKNYCDYLGSFVVSYKFLLILLGWHCFTNLYGFQVHNSTKHHLHTASCTHHPKQSLFPSPFSHFSHLHLPPTPFPSGYYHTVLCVYVYYTCFFANHFSFFHPVPPQPSPLTLRIGNNPINRSVHK